ncbi:MAG: glycosyltransferase family 2 protein [Candidatus Saccharibacteria bacterium]|nr:glycosyltransferase family 2 protein [Moraxellaceae bacterium]
MLNERGLPSVTLIIPTFNRADLISETLKYAFSQTVRFSEIIVIDDGSTDDTAAILKQYGAELRVIRTTNQGVQAARNRGVREATTEYVVFCDSDDLLLSNYVEVIFDWLARHKACNSIYINFNKFNFEKSEPDHFTQAPREFFEGAILNEQFVSDIPDLYARHLVTCALYLTGLAITKDLYEKIGGFDESFKGVGAEDSEFTLRVISSGNTALCRLPLAKIRRHSGNDSGDSLRMTVGSVKILEYILNHHERARAYRLVIRSEIDRLRRDAAIVAFSKKDFETTKTMLSHDFADPLSVKFILKKIIIHLPNRLRDIAWRLTQTSKD